MHSPLPSHLEDRFKRLEISVKEEMANMELRLGRQLARIQRILLLSGEEERVEELRKLNEERSEVNS